MDDLGGFGGGIGSHGSRTCRGVQTMSRMLKGNFIFDFLERLPVKMMCALQCKVRKGKKWTVVSSNGR